MKPLPGLACLIATGSMLLAYGCGGDDSLFDSAPAQGGSKGDAASEASAQAGSAGQGGTAAAGAGGQGGAAGAAGCPGGCDDGVDCTIDTCQKGSCVHVQGTCPIGELCDLKAGCIKAPICATEAQCTALWGNDPCKTHVRCDAATATCQYDVLDGDKDLHPPLVCGGDDCDDADAQHYPGNVETCDGKDNDCDATVDDAASCPGVQVCQAGACVCPPGNQCGVECPCGPNELCTGGVCQCAKTVCNGTCVDTAVDNDNCGTCGTHCSLGACKAGVCPTCLPGGMLILIDQSGSMSGNKFTSTIAAIKTFVQDPASTFLSVGVMFYPRSSAECAVSSYSPDVPISTLPGNAAPIVAATSGQSLNGMSVFAPVLEAGISPVRTWETANPNRVGVVVMINDGVGSGCNGDGAAASISIAGAGYAGSPSVITHIIGLESTNSGDVANWSSIAAAGGGSFQHVSPASTQAVLNALQSIRGKLMCP